MLKHSPKPKHLLTRSLCDNEIIARSFKTSTFDEWLFQRNMLLYLIAYYVQVRWTVVQFLIMHSIRKQGASLTSLHDLVRLISTFFKIRRRIDYTSIPRHS